MIKEYYKLVRDKVPEIIANNGSVPFISTIEDDRLYKLELDNKLVEEVDELICSHDIEEFADVLEVLESIAKSRGISWDRVLEVKESKKNNRGGFNKRVFLDKVREV